MNKHLQTFLTGLGFGTLVGWAIIALSFLFTSIGHTSTSNVLTLSKKNTVVLHDVFTEQTTSAVAAQAIAISGKLPANQPIYLYLDTPGGEVVAGEHMVDVLKGLPQEVKTITNFAASMGFITVQSLGERLITPSGVLMSHRATVGAEGQIPGELFTRLGFWAAYTRDIEDTMAKRMGITTDNYINLIYNEYWVHGHKAVAAHAADRVVTVRCGADMLGTYDQTLTTMFGDVKLTWSECPLISFPVGIAMDNLDSDEAQSVIREAYYNKYTFASDRDANTKFFHLVK